jgi:hypothetical protein
MLRDNNQYGEWVEDDLALLLEALQGAGSDLGTLGSRSASSDFLSCSIRSLEISRGLSGETWSR